MSEALDMEELRSWIGREEVATDLVDARLARALEAILDREVLEFEHGEEAPLGIHWCLAPPIARQSALGPDGHPARGEFLPPVPLPRRMWAGGRLRFHDPLQVGEKATRRSWIEDIALKQGRSGTLCFVTVRHDVSTDRGVAVEERQDIVYREAAGANAPTPPAPPAEPRVADLSRSMTADPTLLFRYSAITFNAHRIHYDADYCRDVEHYPGLVVHGPLEATLLIQLAQEMTGIVPAVFSFRGVAPLFAGEPFTLNAAEADDGIDLWIAKENGVVTMQAEARF